MGKKFKEFIEKCKKRRKIHLFWVSYLSFLVCYFRWGGIGSGIIGLLFANELQKESGLDYKTERIVSIVGIVVSVLIGIIGIFLHTS